MATPRAGHGIDVVGAFHNNSGGTMLVRLNSLVVMSLLLALASVAGAQDKPTATGTWKWSQAGRQGGNPVEWTMKLKQEGDKLTGTVMGTFGGNPVETAISDGTVKDGEVKFNVVREGQDGT